MTSVHDIRGAREVSTYMPEQPLADEAWEMQPRMHWVTPVGRAPAEDWLWACTPAKATAAKVRAVANFIVW